MKKVISLALFGDSTRKDGSGMNYHAYLPSYVLACNNLFESNEGWELHIHVDQQTLAGDYGAMLMKMNHAHLAHVVAMPAAELTKAMLWRMKPVFQHGVGYVFCRDIDCIPMPRDRAICDTFIASGCVVSTVHDSGSHTGIMGGLCGFDTKAFRESTKLYTLQDLYNVANQSAANWARHGTDQTVLNRLIDAPGGPPLLEFRYNGWHAGPHKFAARNRGEYLTKSYSTVTPDVGKSRLTSALQCEADLLANHLGAAGFEIDKARAFWDKHGDQRLAELVRECER